jgi:ADP-dependent phosphofructokinase/glucokinase
MFLKLTYDFTNNEKIRININNIATYVATPDHRSCVCLNDGARLFVKETAEEIDRLLASAYVTIKEAYENRTTEVPQHPTNSQIDDSEQLQSGSCGSNCEHCSCL